MKRVIAMASAVAASVLAIVASAEAGAPVAAGTNAGAPVVAPGQMGAPLPGPSQAAIATTLPGAAAFPESLAGIPGSSSFFVSSFVTGAIYKGRLGSQARQFLPAGQDSRTSATGLHVDTHGRLFALTGAGQQLEIFNAVTGRRLGDFTATPRPGSDLDDLAVTQRGDVYVTDFGTTPLIYRISAAEIARHTGPINVWLAPPTRVVPKLPSSNLNGIALTPDNRYLLVGQTGNGALYRVDLARRSIIPVTVTGGSLISSDGILLLNHTLYVARHNNTIAELQLNASFNRARMLQQITSPTLNFPTSIKQIAGKLVITNAIKTATAANYLLTVLPGDGG